MTPPDPSAAPPVKVAELMSTTVEFIAGNAPVKEAAELMGELDVGALPVGGPESLEGIVTDRDILFRVVAAGRDPNATLVRDIATGAVIAARDGDTIRAAMDLMAANHLRRLPVQDDRGRVTGWITLADISRKLLVDSRRLQGALREITEGGGDGAG